jgi:hypothetical protein
MTVSRPPGWLGCVLGIWLAALLPAVAIIGLALLGAVLPAAPEVADVPAVVVLVGAAAVPCFGVESTEVWELEGAPGAACAAEFCEAGSACLHAAALLQSRTQTIDSSIRMRVA